MVSADMASMGTIQPNRCSGLVILNMHAGGNTIKSSSGSPVSKVRPKGLAVNLVNLALFSIGAFFLIFAYLSFLPLLAASLFFGATYLLLFVPKLGGSYERKIFTRVFAMGIVASGVAAIYANYFLDAGQLYSDPASFFDMASRHYRDLSLIELQVMHEGSLAILIWGWAYDAFAAFGFPRERYVGILVNVTVVGLSGVVALKITRMVYGYDPERFRRLIILFSSCGLFWLFAGIHLRGSVVLLSVTVLAYSWLYFLDKPTFGWRLAQLVIFSLLSSLSFGFLRSEFIFVPIAMALAGITALIFGRKHRKNRLVPYALVLLGLAAAGVLLAAFGEGIQYALLSGKEDYKDHIAAQHSSDSLGVALVINQPMPVRLVLGSIYLFVFPIPFWSGFQLESAYNLFKSFNAVFFYFFLPLLVLALRKIWKDKHQRTPAMMFILFLSIGFTLAIAGTSLETRHFGAFLAPIFVLALLPDFSSPIVRRNYKKLLIFMVNGVLLVHLAWAALKI